MEAVIWHNPRCSKSRGALELLAEHGVDVAVVRYLDEAPGRAALEDVLRKRGTDDPRAIIRTGEALYRELGLASARVPVQAAPAEPVTVLAQDRAVPPAVATSALLYAQAPVVVLAADGDPAALAEVPGRARPATRCGRGR